MVDNGPRRVRIYVDPTSQLIEEVIEAGRVLGAAGVHLQRRRARGGSSAATSRTRPTTRSSATTTRTAIELTTAPLSAADRLAVRLGEDHALDPPHHARSRSTSTTLVNTVRLPERRLPGRRSADRRSRWPTASHRPSDPGEHGFALDHRAARADRAAGALGGRGRVRRRVADALASRPELERVALRRGGRHRRLRVPAQRELELLPVQRDERAARRQQGVHPVRPGAGRQHDLEVPLLDRTPRRSRSTARS